MYSLCPVRISVSFPYIDIKETFNVVMFWHRLVTADSSEYLAACDARRAFISGFNGSAGKFIIVLVKDESERPVQAVRLSLARKHLCSRMGDTSCKLVSSWTGEWIDSRLTIATQQYLTNYVATGLS